MFAFEVFAIGLAMITVGLRPTDGFDLSKLREDTRWRHIRSAPDAEQAPSEHRRRWDDDEESAELRRVLEKFPVRHPEGSPPQRPPWDLFDDDGTDNVDENGDETVYRIRKRYYVPPVSCDSASMGHGVGAGSHHGSTASKLMRMPRRMHRRSAELPDDVRRRRTGKEDEENEQRRVTVKDNDLRVTNEDETPDSKAFSETTGDSVKRGHTRRLGGDESLGTDHHQEQPDVFHPSKEDSQTRGSHHDERQRDPNHIAVEDAARSRHHSLSDMLDLQRKLRYEGINQAAPDRRDTNVNSTV